MMRSACRRCGGRGSIMTTPCVLCRGSGQTKQRQTVKVPVPAGTWGDDASEKAVWGQQGMGKVEGFPRFNDVHAWIPTAQCFATQWAMCGKHCCLCGDYVVSVTFYFRCVALQGWRTARLFAWPLGRRKSSSRSGLVGLIYKIFTVHEFLRGPYFTTRGVRY